MSMGFGSGEPSDAQTMRGRNWPCLTQFCIFLENRVGQLHELLRKLEGHDLRIVALSVADSVDCAVARVMLDNVERGREIFELSGVPFVEVQVIGVELPDNEQPYLSVCTALLQAEVNIHYTYPLLYRHRGRGAIALFVDDIEFGLSVLQEKGLRVLTEGDLQDDDEFF